MVEEAVGRVAHRPDHGELVINLGEFRKCLGKVDSRNLGGDGLKSATHIVGHIFLWVPEVEMTWATLKVDHDDTLGFSPARSAGFLFFFGQCLGLKHGAK